MIKYKKNVTIKVQNAIADALAYAPRITATVKRYWYYVVLLVVLIIIYQLLSLLPLNKWLVAAVQAIITIGLAILCLNDNLKQALKKLIRF